MMPPFPVTRAFILGAGLGVRLRPLTQDIPKPLLPVRGRPLVAHGIRHLAAAGVREAIINTHHAAERWSETFPGNECDGVRIIFRHEPVLLDTGGGLKNVEDFLADHGTFFIYNGDILTTLPLEQALAHHRRHGNLVTMVLRSDGAPKHVALDAGGRVVDIRGMLGSGKAGSFLFTGIHVVEPDIFRHIPAVKIESIIAIYLNLIRQGLHVGGMVLDEGEWSDVGTRSEYERVNQSFQHGGQSGGA